jgi:hypothetical protein
MHSALSDVEHWLLPPCREVLPISTLPSPVKFQIPNMLLEHIVHHNFQITHLHTPDTYHCEPISLTFHHCWIDIYPWDCRERSTLAIWNSLLWQNLENKNWHNENECGHDIASVTHKLSDHCHYQWIVVTSAITTRWLHRLPPVDVGKCTRIYQNFRQTTRQMFVSWVSFTYPELIPHTLTAWFS